MNIQAILTQEMHELRRRNPAFHALLNQLLHHKDGKGNYSVDRHEWLDDEPDIDTLAARIQRNCETVQKNESA